jgi:ribonuclease D
MVGMVFNGENVGRYGKVAWIILVAGKTLIPLDILSLSRQTPRLWDILKRRIFSNEKLMKIMHDCRPAADYLHHVHNIQLLNVFDTQVGPTKLPV